MFMGEYNHTIDAKGRLIIPSRFRELLGEEFVLTRGLDGCLSIYPMDEWAAFEEKLRALPLTNKDARTFSRFFVAGATTCQLDKQGRILVPQTLRQFAGLEKDVVLTGNLNRSEVWSKEKWSEGMANGSVLLIAGAILVPVLAWFTQWLNYKLMPQAPSSNNGNKTANSMENSMKTMNTVMPVFSAFMCLSFSIGIGIYWIAGALVRSVQQVVINRHMSSIDMDEVIRKNQEKAAKKREKAGLPPQKITQAATQSVRNIQVQENEEPSAEEKEAARKASTEYYNSNQEYRAGSIAAKANMVKQFDEKNSKKKK